MRKRRRISLKIFETKMKLKNPNGLEPFENGRPIKILKDENHMLYSIYSQKVLINEDSTDIQIMDLQRNITIHITYYNVLQCK